jgi:hypothetical protein
MTWLLSLQFVSALITFIFYEKFYFVYNHTPVYIWFVTVTWDSSAHAWHAHAAHASHAATIAIVVIPGVPKKEKTKIKKYVNIKYNNR